MLAIVGRNGAGKTSLLEAVHFGALAWSPRTSDDSRVVAHRRRGHARRAERVAARRRRPTWAVGFQPGTPKRATVDGAPCATIDALAEHAAVLVFTPERLAVMKGAPALRRRYLDRAVARSWPRYAAVAGAYAGALQQRNQLLRRLRAGARAHDALAPWEAQLAQLGSEIRRARGRFVRGAARAVRRSTWPRSASSTSRSSCATRRAGPTTRPGSWPSSRRAAPATSSAAARRPARTTTSSRSRRASATCAATARRASSARPCWRCSRPRPISCARCAACGPCCCSTTSPASSTAAARRACSACCAQRGQVLVTATDTHQLGEACDRVIRVDGGRAHPE